MYLDLNYSGKAIDQLKQWLGIQLDYLHSRVPGAFKAKGKLTLGVLTCCGPDEVALNDYKGGLWTNVHLLQGKMPHG